MKSNKDNKNINLEPETERVQDNTIIMHNDDEEVIDLYELLMVLLDRIGIIIMAFLVGAILVSAYVYMFVEPTYQSVSKLYIVSASSDSVVNLSDLNIGTSLTADYEQLMMSDPVLEQVIEQQHLSMEIEQLKQMITLNNPKDSRIIEIMVTSTDAEQAMKLSNCIAKVACKYLPDTMSTNAPNIAQNAKIAKSRSGPSYIKYTLIGGLLFAIICVIIIYIQYIMDDTIHSADDMKKFFNIVPLTTIPESDEVHEYDGHDKEN